MYHNAKTKKLKTRDKTQTDNCVFIIQDFPMSLKLNFKAVCARRNVSMKQKLIQLVREHIAQEGLR